MPEAPNKMSIELPDPGETEKLRSQQLLEVIADAIVCAGGGISFSEFIERCLYTPKLGYYESDSTIFGREGDFVTAPELSSHFALAIANQYQRLVQNGYVANRLMEIGAGSGTLCRQILCSLAKSESLPTEYLIVERSAALRRRQQAKLQDLPEMVRSRVRWVQMQQIDAFSGYIVANELFDALPFALVEKENNCLYEMIVSQNPNGDLIMQRRAASADLHNELGDALPNLEIAYRTEFNSTMRSVMEDISSHCLQAVFCVIDYGFTRSEYYHPDRSMGTMICCYRNRVHDDPFYWPGLQDISCSVDFSCLTEYASRSGWKPLAYSPLAHFLLANGILDDASPQAMSSVLSVESQNLKKLLLPSEMGERFQFLLLAKNVTVPASLLTMRDYRFKL